MSRTGDLLADGIAAHNAGNLDDARYAFEAVLQEDPYHTDALHRLGLISAQKNELREAIAYLRSAAAADKSRADVYADLGVVYRMSGDSTRAERNLKRAIELDGERADFHYNLGLVLNDLARPEDAREAYRQTVELNSEHAAAHNNLGNILKSLNDWDGASNAYRAAIKADSGFALAHKNLADILETEGDTAGAGEAYAMALRLRPDPGTRIREALLLPVLPESADQIADLRAGMNEKLDRLLDEDLHLTDPLREVGATNFLTAYHGLEDLELQSKLADLYLKACPDLAFEAPHCRGWLAGLEGGKIRIGFVSAFSYGHTIARLNAGLIQGLPRNRFEVIFYTLAEVQDEMAHALAASLDKVVYLPRKLDMAREKIAADGLDILYFTDIGMEPVSYFLSLSRLAPVQCATWGHPVTSGSPSMDYFISSRLTEPAGAEESYRESLVQLDDFSTCVADPEPEAGREASSRGRILCPQSLFKFHPEFDGIIGDILARCPDAELQLLHGSRPGWGELLMARLRRTIPGVVDRISFAPRKDRGGFLDLLASADVVLDTPHFCGGMTTYETLAVGTPVVTLPGDFMRGRLSLGLYRQMGFEDCIAKDATHYAELVEALVKDNARNKEARDDILACKPKIFDRPEPVDQHIQIFEKAMFGPET
ncbi:MAG: tetratricopeptide repeat protein [Rhodospirillaceae bacterium]